MSVWWQRTTIYQVCVRSFFDANGDGVGDLPGVIAKLDYLEALGVETLWLTPIFASPLRDFGYDIVDYYAVHPDYGTTEDVSRLIAEAHRRGMRVVFDLVLNHTSDEHPWFVDARSSRTSPFRDYYLWSDGKKPGKPPNNWTSMLAEPGWTYDSVSGQWYFASFLPFQPDLNYRNPNVRAAMLAVVRHWLSLGVDGFRLDIFNFLFKDAALRDNPFSWRMMPSDDDINGFFQQRIHSVDQPETVAFARALRAVVDQFTPARFLVGEVFGNAQVLRRYLGDPNAPGINLVFLFKAVHTEFSARRFRALIGEFEHTFSAPQLPTWVVGNHDRSRVLDRLDGDVSEAKILALLQLTARGVPCLYYGDEIAMRSRTLPDAVAHDPLAQRNRKFRLLREYARKRGFLLNRDEARRPMQWSAETHAGFTTATPWLTVDPAHATSNVEQMTSDPTSLLACYRRFLALRRETEALTDGALTLLGDDAHVLSFERHTAKSRAQIHLNFSKRPRRISHSGGTLRSTIDDRVSRSGPTEYTLAPREGIVVIEPQNW